MSQYDSILICPFRCYLIGWCPEGRQLSISSESMLYSMQGICVQHTQNGGCSLSCSCLATPSIPVSLPDPFCALLLLRSLGSHSTLSQSVSYRKVTESIVGNWKHRTKPNLRDLVCSNGERDRIHVSSSTAECLKKAGKGHWLTPRTDKVLAKVRAFNDPECSDASSDSQICPGAPFIGKRHTRHVLDGGEIIHNHV